ncbi:hypothetical protein D9619_008211 [Psilocybe cf. subviscida]|uniref:Nephrocystin 3-like N-terminal domain-containing protein n=1 Tax=Psilocybe cf. subviscida TaxID=2480587 RepID=A0A8H5AU31_9AGAR|nr:hypothetical protein D9619_008211 [Psilocybe cf. subviscida]
MTTPALTHSASILSNANNTTIRDSTMHLNSRVTINQGYPEAAQGPTVNNTVVVPIVNNGDIVIEKRRQADLIRELCIEVATSALRNAVGQEPESICFPGTRLRVFSEINEWIAGKGGSGHQCRIMWLTGPAGCGKSAIIQSVFNSCLENQLAVASFFFRREDATRNRIRPLVPTLAYQLAVHPGFPGAKDEARQVVASLIDDNPLLFTLSIEIQFRQLLQCIQPLSSDPKPVILLIDALDECDPKERKEQGTLIEALRTLLGEVNGYRFKLLIASRDEAHLKMRFASMRQMVHTIHLDNNTYNSKDDIEALVSALFDSIKSTHPLMVQDDLNLGTWPADDDINHIVSKSSGQFLYAATVMQFIAEPRRSPVDSLRTVINPARNPSPSLESDNAFAVIDAVYSYIFSTVFVQWDKVRPILAAHIILSRIPPNHNLQHCLHPLGICMESVNSVTSWLSAVVRYDSEKKQLLFHHASLADFLVDEKRADAYHIDINSFAITLVTAIIKKRNINLSDFQFTCLVLENVQEPSDDLGQTLLKPPNLKYGQDSNGFNHSVFFSFLKSVHTLYAHQSPPQELEGIYHSLLETWLEWSFDHLEESFGTMTDGLTKYGIEDGREIWENVVRKRGLPRSERQVRPPVTEQQRENGDAFIPEPRKGLMTWGSELRLS